jgi:hypothetical protein
MSTAVVITGTAIVLGRTAIVIDQRWQEVFQYFEIILNREPVKI